MTAPAAADDAFVMLEARHVDGLTDAVRNLARLSAQGIELQKRQLEATKANTETMREHNALMREQVQVTRDLVKLLKSTRDDVAAATTPSGRKRG